MEYNILIVEDNDKARKLLVSLIQSIDADINILEAGNIDTAYRYAVQNNIHLFLLDIVLNPTVRSDASGITFAGHMSELEKYKRTPIIFITSLEDYKLFAYSELHCYQYIEKPFQTDKVISKIREALDLATPDEKTKFISFKKDGILYPLTVSRIQYINCEKPITQFFLTDDFLEINYIPINKIMYQLSSPDFIQCNRNMILNKNYVENIDPINNFIQLKQRKEPLPLGNAYKKKLMRDFRND